MKKNAFFLLFAALIFTSACKTITVVEKSIVIIDTVYIDRTNHDYLLMSVLWYQTSSEMRALCYQAFNSARLHLDEVLAKNKQEKKLAIITDIDETIVDNSPYQAANILKDFGYPLRWGEWVERAEAYALPGAVGFMQYAAKKGVEVFYISNRKTTEQSATIKNMKTLGFPMADTEHLLLRDKTSSKIERREKVEKEYEVVMLLGDNMNDFSGLFENMSIDKRFAVADSLNSEFGKKFIILPNPMYGDWESAALKYNFKLSEDQKDKVRKSWLRGM